jgi:4-diphosphocytidyl-2-C-methyl-D-erythritol kinase
MVLYSPAKVNIGLHIIERRTDGFHNLQSVMMPVGLCDILEIRRSTPGQPGLVFSQSGIPVDAVPGGNLCEKAHRIFSEAVPLPPVRIHLHKQIPVGAGLGGGSSNASLTLRGLNRFLAKPLPEVTLHEMAASLGSDCPFFLHSGPMMVEGRGERLRPLTLDLGAWTMVVLYPGIHVSTAEAYSGVKPALSPLHLEELLLTPISGWKELVVNDFEPSIFRRHPELEQIKQDLYRAGAVYASLSGSGSSLFGMFNRLPDLPAGLSDRVVWKGVAGIVPRPT